MDPRPRPVAEFTGVDARKFRSEIATRYEPAILRGLVRDWPAVAEGVKSPEACSAYLNGFDSGGQVDALMIPPAGKGRIFYRDERMSGFNYSHDRLPITKVNEQLVRYAKFESRPAVAVQSASIPECLPGFVDANPMPVLDAGVAPRIWLGNRVTTPAHFDESNNVACVVAGRRRFTLFPPEQVANLYIGPLDFAPTGTPISMVSFAEPDFAKHPRFRDALAAARVAELEPGDAIFIPTLWWHHVESLAKYNVLVNYWWREAVGDTSKANSALNSLLLAMLTLKHLPAEQREAWRAIFDHYVFRADSHLADHIPPARRSVLGDMTPKMAEDVRAFLVSQLQKPRD